MRQWLYIAFTIHRFSYWAVQCLCLISEAAEITCPVVEMCPKVMQACSRSGRCAFRARCLCCNPRASKICDARWGCMPCEKSRWETYLKLCRTKWDRKWDSQLMVLLSSPLPGYYLQHCCPWLFTHYVWIIMQIFPKGATIYVHVAKPFLNTDAV